MKKLGAFITGTILGSIGTYFFAAREPAGGTTANNMDTMTERFRKNYNLMVRWMTAAQNHKSIADTLSEQGIHSVAIYGMGEIGTLLYNELKDTEIAMPYAIDNGGAYAELEIRRSDDTLDSVDAIIVSVIYAYDEIKSDLQGKFDGKIVSLEEIIA